MTIGMIHDNRKVIPLGQAIVGGFDNVTAPHAVRTSR